MNGYDPLAPRPPMVPNSPMQPKMQAPGNPQQAAQQSALEEALLGTYGDVMEMDSLKEQMAQAQALRGTPTPEGRDSGRVYTAANPLEHIGAGIQRYRAGKEVRDLREGVRNPGYAPGVTSTPQPEWKREGIRGIGKRIGENVKKYGLNLPE